MMSKGLWIYLIILVIVLATADFFILKTDHITPDITQKFTISSARYIMVRGTTGQVDVDASSNDYFRITAGDVFTEGKYVSPGVFQSSGQLPTGKWEITESSSLITFTVNSPSYVVITTVPKPVVYPSVLIITFIIGFIFFVVGVSFAHDL